MNMNKLMHYKLVLAAGVLAPFLFLFSLSIFADNPQPIKFRGVNALGEEIFLMHHGREENRERKSWSVYVGTRPGEYQMTEGQQCIIKNQLWSSNGLISCNNDGGIVLSGTTYKFVKNLGNCRGFVFVCSIGCGERTPREMILEEGCDYD